MRLRAGLFCKFSYRNVVELDPDFVPARLALGQAYVQKQMFPEAIRELEKAVQLSGGSPMHLASLAHAYGVTGRNTTPPE